MCTPLVGVSARARPSRSSGAPRSSRSSANSSSTSPSQKSFESNFAEAVAMIGDHTRAARWMLSPIRALASKTPIDALTCGPDWEKTVRQSLRAIR